MENLMVSQSNWEKKGGIFGLFKGSQNFGYAFWLFFCLPYMSLLVINSLFARITGASAVSNNLSLFVPVIIMVSIISLFVLIINIKNAQSKVLAYIGLIIAAFVIVQSVIEIVKLLILSLQ